MRGQSLPPLEFDQLKGLDFLDRCLKETLRLRPPIMTMMRMVKTPQVGVCVCVCGVYVCGVCVCVLRMILQKLSQLMPFYSITYQFFSLEEWIYTIHIGIHR